MILSEKIKEELINEQGYDFNSEYWTDDNIILFEEIIIATENVVKKLTIPVAINNESAVCGICNKKMKGRKYILICHDCQKAYI